MPRRKKKKTAEEYAFLGIKMNGYIARINASINHGVRDSRHYYDDAMVYESGASLDIDGTCTYPEEREGETYQFSIYGAELSRGNFDLKLDDCHVRDENGERVYRKARGKEIPVYDIPKGIGPLVWQRDAKLWSGWCWVKPSMVTNMLALLPSVDPLYIGIHELTVERKRWIVGLTLQTSDPGEE